ncbi:hypothetical protein KY361_00495 [Candidatus Woesearchaeota archaeon]|nr:hypothetical protein [Candidatus Woesearchaeota archaeon]
MRLYYEISGDEGTPCRINAILYIGRKLPYTKRGSEEFAATQRLSGDLEKITSDALLNRGDRHVLPKDELADVPFPVIDSELSKRYSKRSDSRSYSENYHFYSGTITREQLTELLEFLRTVNVTTHDWLPEPARLRMARFPFEGSK